MNESAVAKSTHAFRNAMAVTIVAFTAIATSATEPKSAMPGIAGVVDALRSEIIPARPGKLSDFQERHDETKPLVVLVPGLLATDTSMNSIRDELLTQKFGTCGFNYSSDKGIVSGATQLSTELRRVGTQWPSRPVVLLTHSMGGLVARACVEDPNLDPGNVSRLIMIAPPNHGSAVAGLSAAELAKKFTLPSDVVLAGLEPIDEAISGFVGNVKEELRPDSPVLVSLNSKPRSANVSYSIIAGTGGPIQGELIEMSLVLGSLIFGDKPEAKEPLERVSELARLDEWTRGRGDGVVSVKSAKLAGVTDVVELPFGHNDFGTETSEVTKQVVDEILDRLTP